MDAELRRRVLARDGFRCRRCGQTAGSVHHRLPRSRGGPDDERNLVSLCGDGVQGCHGAVEHHPAWARLEGWTVAGYFLRGFYTGPSAEYRQAYPSHPDVEYPTEVDDG